MSAGVSAVDECVVTKQQCDGMNQDAAKMMGAAEGTRAKVER